MVTARSSSCEADMEGIRYISTDTVKIPLPTSAVARNNSSYIDMKLLC